MEQVVLIDKDKNITEYAIYKTMDYSQFGHIKGNRRISTVNYARLEKSMLEEQLVIPICVNGKMQIVDGQHRFEVAKNNQMPLYYYVVENYEVEQVKRANMVARTWGKKEFLTLQLASGKESYVIFNRLLTDYGVNIQDLLKVFSHVQNKNLSMMSKAFEEGSFEAMNHEVVEAFLQGLHEFKLFKHYRTSQFLGAFMKLYFYERYDHEKMVDRIKKRENVLTKKSSIGEYLVMLTREIYSFGAIKDPIFFDALTKKFY